MGDGRRHDPDGDRYRFVPSWQRPSPATPHIEILETAEGLGIYNPAKRSWPLVVFLLVWLCGWAVGETFAIGALFSSPLAIKLFLGVWLTFWTIGGLTVAGAVLWKLGGSELLFVTADAVVREIRFWGLTRRTVVDLDAVTGFDIDTALPKEKPYLGPIRFRSAERSYNFGIGLAEEEAEKALAAIRDYVGRRGQQALPEGAAQGG
jgi:hypothetical protein